MKELGVWYCNKFQSGRSSPRPIALPNGGEMMLLDSLEQLLVEFDATKNIAQVVKVDQRCTTLSHLENKNTGETTERKCRMKSVISSEDLRQHFGRSREDAAKSLGVSISTLKRICRKHDIIRWPFYNKNNSNHSVFKLKLIHESIHKAKGPFNPSPSSLPSVVGSNHKNLTGSKHREPQGEKNTSPTCKTPPTDGRAETQNEMLGHLQGQNLLDSIEGSNCSNTENGSKEESITNPTSRHSDPHNYPLAMGFSISSSYKESREAGGPSELVVQVEESTPLAAYSNPNALMFTEPQIASREVLIENVGNSKDWNILSATEASLGGQVSKSSWTVPVCSDPTPRQSMTIVPLIMPHATASQDMRIVKFKATYRDDIIKFQLPLTSGIAELKEEVAKRLELEFGSFNVKYEDEDHDWILVGCDVDLQDCLKFSSSLENQVIRLLVLDKVANSQHSCKSCKPLKRKIS